MANLDIERIVREVIRRLQSAGADHGGTSGGGQSDVNGPGDNHGTRPGSEREIRGRVISLEALEGQLDGIEQIRIPRGAVVTPSARDKLRRLNVKISYGSPHQQGPAGGELVVASWQTTYDVQSLVNWLRGEGHQTDLATGNDPLQAVIQAVDSGQRLPDGRNRLGLVVSDAPALAVCLANRAPTVRAAWAMDLDAVDEAVRTIAANVLVLQPRRQSWSSMVGIARAFLQGGGGACPSEIALRLGAQDYSADTRRT